MKNAICQFFCSLFGPKGQIFGLVPGKTNVSCLEPVGPSLISPSGGPMLIMLVLKRTSPLASEPFVGSASPLARGSKKEQKLTKNCKIEFFTKTVFFTIQVEIGEVWRCPGGGGRPYEDIVSNFGRVWSYMASESPLFNIRR